MFDTDIDTLDDSHVRLVDELADERQRVKTLRSALIEIIQMDDLSQIARAARAALSTNTCSL